MSSYDVYDEYYFIQADAAVDELRAEALKRVQLTHPEIIQVIDRRTVDDYSLKRWDYPGQWYYMGFQLPKGFRSREQLIDTIASETIRCFTKNRR